MLLVYLNSIKKKLIFINTGLEKSFINTQNNLIGQNVIMWGVLTDGKDMAYQNQSSEHVPAVHQLLCVMLSCTCTLKVFRVSPEREFARFYLVLFNKYYNYKPYDKLLFP